MQRGPLARKAELHRYFCRRRSDQAVEFANKVRGLRRHDGALRLVEMAEPRKSRLFVVRRSDEPQDGSSSEK
jgi:hypothetical protein